jgi:hypothetical protein
MIQKSGLIQSMGVSVGTPGFFNEANHPTRFGTGAQNHHLRVIGASTGLHSGEVVSMIPELKMQTTKRKPTRIGGCALFSESGDQS